jgi:hypothetical protein
MTPARSASVPWGICRAIAAAGSGEPVKGAGDPHLRNIRENRTVSLRLSE